MSGSCAVATEIVFDRRQFLVGSAAGIALLGLPSSLYAATDLTTQPRSPKAWIDTFAARIPISDVASLRTALDDNDALAVSRPGIHYARLVILRDETHLLLEVIYERCERVALEYLVGNGTALDKVLTHCQGYPSGAALARQSLKSFLHPHVGNSPFFYHAYRVSEESIDEGGDSLLPALYAQFVTDIHQAPLPLAAAPTAPVGAPPVFLPHATRTLNMVQVIKTGTVDTADLAKVSKLMKKAGTLVSSLTFPSQPTHLQLFKYLLGSGWFQDLIQRDALPTLKTLHFARVSLIDDTTTQPKMLFASVYDGDFDQYVLDFGTRVAELVDLIWARTEGYPESCTRVREFVRWLDVGRRKAQRFHVGHRPATRLEIGAAKKLRLALLEFVDAPHASDLVGDLRKLVRDRQGLLS
jgi:hypothetical protein